MNSGGKIFLIYTKIKPEPARVDQRFWEREEEEGWLVPRDCTGFVSFFKNKFPGLFQDSD